MKYVVRYRNRQGNRGTDTYLSKKSSSLTLWGVELSEAHMFDEVQDAINMALQHPVVDDGHMPAEVFQVREEPVEVKYELGVRI